MGNPWQTLIIRRHESYSVTLSEQYHKKVNKSTFCGLNADWLSAQPPADAVDVREARYFFQTTHEYHFADLSTYRSIYIKTVTQSPKILYISNNNYSENWILSENMSNFFRSAERSQLPIQALRCPGPVICNENKNHGKSPVLNQCIRGWLDRNY